MKFGGGAPSSVKYSNVPQSGAYFLHLLRLEGIDSEKAGPRDGGNAVNDDDRIAVDRDMARGGS